MGKRRVETISAAQSEALGAFARFADEKGYPPTLMELSVILGISQASTYDRINQLISKGYLKRDDGKSRGITIVNRNSIDPSELVAIPVIGTVAAGTPIFAEENHIGEILVELKGAKTARHFALHVKGKSMIGVGINHGDLVIVRQQVLAENGDIVVALLKNEATVKRLKIKNGIVELVPENPTMKPIEVKPDDDIRIVGKVVGWKSNK